MAFFKLSKDLCKVPEIRRVVALPLIKDRQKPVGLLTVVAMQCLAGEWRKRRN